ncbi:MAG: STAS domain-containing protein [Candidatus Cybelea sp.]
MSSEPVPPSVFVIRLEGAFDSSERTRLTDAFGVPTSVPVVVVDFERVGYVDSTVLNCLIVLERATRERNARLILVGLSPTVERIFAVCKLDEHFDIRRSLNDLGPVEPAQMRRLTLVAQSGSDNDPS